MMLPCENPIFDRSSTMTQQHLALLSKEETLLLMGSCLRPDAAAIGALLPQLDHWDTLTAKAIRAHLSPLLYQNLKASAHQGAVPAEVITTLQKSYNGVLAANIRLYAHLGSILKDWNALGLPVIVLKGMFLAETVYADIGLRHISDMDLLVQPQDVERCKLWATQNGWTVQEMPHHTTYMAENFGSAHPYKFIKASTIIELHVHVHNKGCAYSVDVADYWEHATAGALAGAMAMHLHPSHQIQHLCLHLYKHMMGSELKISSFCDIRESIAYYGAAMDWELLRQSSLRYNAWAEVQAVLHLCREFWAAAVPDDMLTDLAPEKALHVETLFLNIFKHGRPDASAILAQNLDGNLERLAQLQGVGAKLRYLTNYFFPSTTYLRQRYRANGPAVVLCRFYHPMRQGMRGMRGLFRKWFQ